VAVAKNIERHQITFMISLKLLPPLFTVLKNKQGCQIAKFSLMRLLSGQQVFGD
jgi:hypothetical protein